MEFLNGGDLMYHIQDKGRFELYRAMYVRALCRRGTLAECTATLPFILPPTPTPPPPLEKLESGQSLRWGHSGHCGKQALALGPAQVLSVLVVSLGVSQNSRMDSALHYMAPGVRPLDDSSNVFKCLDTPKLAACVAHLCQQKCPPTTQPWLI